ncbi:hypothetical protein JBO49_18065 [Serratia fonticola]|uniref:DUF3592 domain-containing protein n=1 Tax=Serratia fonticola TaxID=47917 RepID=UPI00192ACDD0|nr:DUF3592 domain-containing protein [Serratia fonticola]MBL5862509.1 hypothetical protein [Serratia fonticola]
MSHSFFRECLPHFIAIFVIVVFIKTIVFPLFTGKYRNLVKNGISTTATIVTINQTPGGTNGYINVIIKVSFIEKSGKAVETNITPKIAIMDINKYQPGEKINIKYLEKKPSSAILNPLNAYSN